MERRRWRCLNVTIARELTGWCCSLAVREAYPPTICSIVHPLTWCRAKSDPRSRYEQLAHRVRRRSTLDTRSRSSEPAPRTTKHEALAPKTRDGRLTLPRDRDVTPYQRAQDAGGDLGATQVQSLGVYDQMDARAAGAAAQQRLKSFASCPRTHVRWPTGFPPRVQSPDGSATRRPSV